MGLEICALEAEEDVFDPTLGGPGPHPSVNPDVRVRDDDDVPRQRSYGGR